MYKIFVRFSWIVSILAGLSITFIDDDLFFLWIIAAVTIKFFVLSDGFIKNNILDYNKRLEENILKKLSLNSWIEQRKESVIEPVEDISQTIEPHIQTLWESIESTPKETIPEVPKEPSKVAVFLREFFAENLMAKIGWILLAIGILFLMSLVYSLVWPVAKIIIWFAVWFSVYAIWVLLEKKGYKTESMILLGTSILINYIVTLSGRFIIGESENGIIGSSICFIFLVMNTIFAVLTSYIYSSKNLLLFSVFFAYFIPFLVGSSGSEYSYLIVIWYAIIVTLWTLFVSNQNAKEWNTTQARILFYMSAILWNLLVLAAPLDHEWWFIAKMIGFNIISLWNIYLAYKNNFSKDIGKLFGFNFAYLSLMIGYGILEIWYMFEWVWVMLSYLFSVLFLLICISVLLVKSFASTLKYFLFIPLLLIILLLFGGYLSYGLYIIPATLLVYLVIFSFITTIGMIGGAFQYLLFSLLWVFLVGFSYYYSGYQFELTLTNFTSVIGTGFLFLVSAYYLSSKKDLSYLYTIGTLGTIFIFLPFLGVKWVLLSASIGVIAGFGLLNYFTPFFNKNLVSQDTKNLVLGNIFWVLFLGGNLFWYGYEYFPGVSLWFGFLGLAIWYFIWGFLIFSRLEKTPSISHESNLNFIYTFLGIAISLFSIAVALVFSKLPIAIVLIWLLEGTLVLYFAQKLASRKVLIASILLTIIGLGKYFLALAWNDLWVNDLVGVGMIFINFIWQIVILKFPKTNGIIFTKILHTLWILLVFASILMILDDHADSGKVYVVSGVYITLLLSIYHFLKDDFCKKTTLWFLALLLMIHIWDTDGIRDYYNNYIFTAIIWLIVGIDRLFFKDKNSKYILAMTSLYFFVISSIYLYHITNDAFSLTIYWGTLALAGVHIGIAKENKMVRGFGLYLLILTLGKISFYDIWNSLDNPILRVVAFLFVGGIMMYISTLYSKRKLSIKEDLVIRITSEIQKENPLINEKIKNIDVENIESIEFKKLDGKNFTIKSKKLFKITLLITQNLWKNSFEPHQLESIYANVVKNYTTELSESDYKKVLWVIKDFVEIWGEVIIHKKAA